MPFFLRLRSLAESCGNWRNPIGNFDIDGRIPLNTRNPTTQRCQDNGFPLPPDLSSETFAALSMLPADSPPRSQLHLIWRTTVVAFPDPSANQDAQLVKDSCCAETFLRTPKSTDLQSPHVARRVALSFQRLRIPRVFSYLGPSPKLKTMRRSGAPVSAANSSFRWDAQLNSLRGVRSFYRSFASSIRPYFSLREIKKTRPIAILECAILQRSALFKPDDTYRPCASCVRKDCFYFGGPIDWISPVITNVIKSLSLAGNEDCRCPNFIDSSAALKIINLDPPTWGNSHRSPTFLPVCVTCTIWSFTNSARL